MILNANRHSSRQYALTGLKYLSAAFATCWRRRETLMHNAKKCAYCRAPIEEGKEVKGEVLFIRGSQLARETREYCSARCAEYDRMANEP